MKNARGAPLCLVVSILFAVFGFSPPDVAQAIQIGLGAFSGNEFVETFGGLEDGSPSNCLHCHEVQRMAIDDRRFTITGRQPSGTLHSISQPAWNRRRT